MSAGPLSWATGWSFLASHAMIRRLLVCSSMINNDFYKPCTNILQLNVMAWCGLMCDMRARFSCFQEDQRFIEKLKGDSR